jgi:hypothetical protein
MLGSVNLENGDSWKYDPHHIVISNLRNQINFSPYIHETHIDMDRLANKET